MNNIKTIILITFVALINSACSFSPSSIYGAHGENIEFNPDVIEKSDTFKLSFMPLLPKNEQGYLKQSILNNLEKNARYNDLTQTRGQNGLAIAALGGNPLDGGVGGAASLALNLAARISNANSGEDFTYGIYLSKEVIGSDTADVDEIQRIVRKKASEALVQSAKENGYTVQCLYHCDKTWQTFELTKISEDVNPNEFSPKKLIGYIKFWSLTAIVDDSFIERLHGDKYSHFGALNIIILNVYNEHDDGRVKYWEGQLKGAKDQTTYFYNHGAKNIIGTPLGRGIYRSLGKLLPNWYSAENLLNKTYGVYQGEIYSLEDLSKFNEFHGKLITN